ncbi:MAG: response regulator [Candidatus Peribacteraceae bacterium]|nr:response regulator [Candidatus Peribacteraceae bacterium]
MSTVVFLAEDEPLLREMMEMELREAGMTVHALRNGAELLELLSTKQPSIILLDLLMPVMDGYAVLQQLQQRKTTTPIVVLSNISDPAEEQKCLSLGACDFLIKSHLDSTELGNIVLKYVSK